MFGSIVKFVATASAGAILMAVAMNWSDAGLLDEIKAEIADREAMYTAEEGMTEALIQERMNEWVKIKRPEWRKHFLLNINTADLDKLLEKYN